MFEQRHGLSRTKIYKVWKGMRVRCYSSNKENLGKGEDMSICEEWKDDPVTFANWAKQNGYEEHLRLSRIDKNKGFYPENCVFVDIKEATKTHGMRRTSLYNIWTQMTQRCKNENLGHYNRYGGRGISVCEEWKQFEVFAEWSMNNGYLEGLSIDRIDVDGNYEPRNCRWITMAEQQRNTRRNHFKTINGETKTVAEWAEISDIPYKTLQRRIYTGCKEQDLLAPVGTIYEHKYIVEINGVKKTINQWAKETGLQFSTIKRRYDRGVRGEKLLAKGYKKKEPDEDKQLEFDL